MRRQGRQRAILAATLGCIVLTLVLVWQHQTRRASSGLTLSLPSMSGGPVALDTRTGDLFVPAAGAVLVVSDRTGTQTGAIPCPIVPEEAYLDARTRRVLIAGERGLAILDARSHHCTLLPGQPLRRGDRVVPAGDGRILVLEGRSDQIAVIDLRRRRMDTLPYAVDASQTDTAQGTIALAPHARQLLVTSSLDDSISAVDLRSGHVLTTTVTARAPGLFSVDPGSGQIVVPGSGLDNCATPPLCTTKGAGITLLDAGLHMRWSVPLPAEMPIALAVAWPKGRIFVLTAVEHAPDGTRWLRHLDVYDLRTGRLIRALPLPSVVADEASQLPQLAVDGVHHRVYLTVAPVRYTAAGALEESGSGLVERLDARTGAVLQRQPVDAPARLLVDAPGGRVIVVTGGTFVSGQSGWTNVLPALHRIIPALPAQPAPRFVPPGLTFLSS